jgi:hypothetical protein
MVYKFRQYEHADCSASVFRPYPGNPIYEDCVKGGFREPQSLEEWSDHDFLGTLNVDIPWKKDRWFVEFANFFQTLVFYSKSGSLITKYLIWRFTKTNMLKRAPDTILIYQAKRLLYTIRRLKGLISNVITLKFK